MAGASFSGYIYCYSQPSCSVLSFLIRIVFMGLQGILDLSEDENCWLLTLNMSDQDLGMCLFWSVLRPHNALGLGSSAYTDHYRGVGNNVVIVDDAFSVRDCKC
ncbi:uncharacterized protein BO96DRAFT_439680 [Aspergillus niger CBS 101883]|uniref:Uncharacterized protein n=2 Tax=Aspergillus niger TaxID=5061 RepID=A2QZK4_ASPNC|nr:uncharacterized protein BO96DRAFT_439680 [Aspergillus niger CBS 101883]XP_059604461.1 hypothetical protein An12g05230 [Aspergillus niger]PYH50704.1 hypothetical protein BO96DRAFT_439680 [Aspergillus niger CBS 101883]CAK46236.1 hypothetical protein An12g05230 [Aspergillus niger]